MRRYLAKRMMQLCLCASILSSAITVKASSNYDLIKEYVINNKEIRVSKVQQYLSDAGKSMDEASIKGEIDKVILDMGNEVYSDVGGMLTTYSMLDKQYNEITYVGAHNAFANNQDAVGFPNIYNSLRSLGTMNQYNSIGKMMEYGGIRFLDLDIGLLSNRDVASYHRIYASNGITGLDTISNRVRDFIGKYPNEIVTMKIAQVYDGGFIGKDLAIGNADYEYSIKVFLRYLYKAGILDNVVNYMHSPSNMDEVDPQYLVKPGMTANGHTFAEWPTLKSMIQDEKNIVVLIPGKSESMDYRGPGYAHGDTNPDTLLETVEADSNKLAILEYFEDHGADPGDKACSAGTNNGIRIYELLKKQNELFAQYGRNVNFVTLDFFRGNKDKVYPKDGYIADIELSWEATADGDQDVDAVDAANRINLERVGGWNAVTPYYWQTHPEGDSGILEIQSIQSAFANNDIAPDSTDGNLLIDQNVWSGITYRGGTATFEMTLEESQRISNVYLNFFNVHNNLPERYVVEEYNENTEQYVKIGSGNLNFEAGKAWYKLFGVKALYGSNKIKITLFDDYAPPYLKNYTQSIKINEIAIYGDGKEINENFDGTMSDQWVEVRGNWQVSNNKLVVENTGGEAKMYYGPNTFDDFQYVAKVTLDGQGDAGLIFRSYGISGNRDGYNGYYAMMTPTGIHLIQVNSGQYKYLKSVARSFDIGTAYEIKVTALGKEIQVEVDGEALINVVDEAYKRGFIALKSYNTNAKFDDLNVLRKSYINNFDANKSNYTTVNSRVLTKDEKLVFTNEGLVLSNKDYVDIEYSARMNINSTIATPGLLFRAKKAQDFEYNGYGVNLYPEENKVKLEKVVDGEKILLEEAPLTLQESTSVQVKVETSGQVLRVYFNDEETPTIETSDSTYHRGHVGLYNSYDSTFSHVQIRELMAKGSPAYKDNLLNETNLNTNWDLSESYVLLKSGFPKGFYFKDLSTGRPSLKDNKAILKERVYSDVVLDVFINDTVGYTDTSSFKTGTILRFQDEQNYYYAYLEKVGRGYNLVLAKMEEGNSIELARNNSVVGPAGLRLRVEAIGSKFTVFYGNTDSFINTVLIQAEDDTIKKGQVGFFAHQQSTGYIITFKDFAVRPIEAVPYQDEFDNQDRWSLNDLTYVEKNYKKDNIISMDYGIMKNAIRKDSEHEDVTFEADMTFDGSSEVLSSEFLLRGGNFGTRIGEYDGYKITLVKGGSLMITTARSHLGSSVNKLPNKNDYHLKVELVGNSIKAYVDGELYLDLQDDTYTSGIFAVLGLNGLRYDNLSLKRPGKADINDTFYNFGYGYYYNMDNDAYNAQHGYLMPEIKAYAKYNSPQAIGDFIMDVEVMLAESTLGSVFFRAQGINKFRTTDGYKVEFDDERDEVILWRVSGGKLRQLGKASILDQNVHQLRINAKGSKLQIFVDEMESPVMTAWDSTFASGDIYLYGLCKYDETSWDIFPTLSFDSFSLQLPEATGLYANLLGSWTNHWDLVKMDGREIGINANKFKALVNTSRSYSDLEATTEIVLSGRGESGIFFRAKTTDNGYDGYYAYFDGINSIGLKKVVEGAEIILGTQSLEQEIDLDMPQILKVSAKGSTIVVSVEGRDEEITVIDQVFTLGQTGLYIGSNPGTTTFKNLDIKY